MTKKCITSKFPSNLREILRMFQFLSSPERIAIFLKYAHVLSRTRNSRHPKSLCHHSPSSSSNKNDVGTTMTSSHRIFNTMPTVVALDVSLSMSRPVLTEASEEYQRRHFAIHGIGTFLDVLSSSCKLEFVSLVGCFFFFIFLAIC